MSETGTCPKCGAELPENAPHGICPKCLMLAAMGAEPEMIADESQDQDVSERFVPPEPSELAAHFPQLEILELIGKGGMGAVYRARQPGLDRFVAVKILPAEIAADSAFAERFSREARALAKLNHPNIVSVYDFGHVGQLYYFVMEYVDGTNLRELIHAGELEPQQALEIVPQICIALQFAHDEGIVHRDIKPENILVDQQGRVKIADFGLAKLLGKDPDDVTLTGAQQAMGTLHYMAPEQLRGAGSVDHRADIYSLGVVFYELLTGDLPVGRYQLPSESGPVDSRLDEIVMRALEREPSARYQQAHDVKTDIDTLGSVLAGELSPGSGEKLAKPPIQDKPNHPRPDKPIVGDERVGKLSRIGRRLLLVMMAAGVLFVLAGAMLAVWRFRLWEKPARMQFVAHWEEPEAVSQKELDALQAVINARLVKNNGDAIAAVDVAGSRLAPATSSHGTSDLAIKFYLGEGTPENLNLARSRLSIRGTCQLRILVDGESDGDLVQQLGETAEGGPDDAVVELSEGVRVVWLPVHYSSIIALENDERVVTRERSRQQLGSQLEVLAWADDFQLNESHISAAQVGNEAEFDDVLLIDFKPQAKVAWKRLLSRYELRIDSFFPSRQRDGRRLALVLDGELHAAKYIETLGRRGVDAIVDFKADSTTIRDWAIALESGPLPAPLAEDVKGR